MGGGGGGGGGGGDDDDDNDDDAATGALLSATGWFGCCAWLIVCRCFGCTVGRTVLSVGPRETMAKQPKSSRLIIIRMPQSLTILALLKRWECRQGERGAASAGLGYLGGQTRFLLTERVGKDHEGEGERRERGGLAGAAALAQLELLSGSTNRCCLLSRRSELWHQQACIVSV